MNGLTGVSHSFLLLWQNANRLIPSVVVYCRMVILFWNKYMDTNSETGNRR